MGSIVSDISSRLKSTSFSFFDYIGMLAEEVIILSLITIVCMSLNKTVYCISV